ncbi:MAG: Holliday junction branch migration protein RuvA [Oscillospiraceae bacterium]|nr:Holliday junction branch migration protein RuvA [Oscillospiraceae bacterium]
MIYSLRGKLIMAQPGVIVVECGGVGYKCAVSLTTLSMLPNKGSEVFIYTYMNVREDAVDLFGFADERELDAFKLLTSVNGVGPKAGLALLSDFTFDKLALAIASGDSKALTKTAGIGNKIAQRIVLELKDKLGGISTGNDDVIAKVTEAVANRGNISEAIAALCSLGYGQSEAAAVLAGCDESSSVEELIKFGLKKLAKF